MGRWQHAKRLVAPSADIHRFFLPQNVQTTRLIDGRGFFTVPSFGAKRKAAAKFFLIGQYNPLTVSFPIGLFLDL